jgi:hypothetical protein
LLLTGVASRFYSEKTIGEVRDRVGWENNVSKRNSEARIEGFVGVGLDNQDGHQRLTRAEHFVLVGGSAETHERMQDTAIRFGEALQKRGKTLQETSAEEAIELLRKSMERSA